MAEGFFAMLAGRSDNRFPDKQDKAQSAERTARIPCGDQQAYAAIGGESHYHPRMRHIPLSPPLITDYNIADSIFQRGLLPYTKKYPKSQSLQADTAIVSNSERCFVNGASAPPHHHGLHGGALSTDSFGKSYRGRDAPSDW
ncbi:hypothetical protein R3P38DRAFT_3169537 [Favolaschia claudopus]|uniref:Uncharacterized protein n=1 Tax=Favolaschia claudopus TaxID=2862362 RepID=A0AAW0E2U9_9AGAR